MASGLVDEDDEATPGFDFVPSQDVAAQAALLAVSSFDRSQLKSLCVDDAAYKTTLAQRGSVAAKDVVEVCYAGDYAKALSFIAALGDELALDPVLAPMLLLSKRRPWIDSSRSTASPTRRWT